jgi:Tol biopolymer transport system component
MQKIKHIPLSPLSLVVPMLSLTLLMLSSGCGSGKKNGMGDTAPNNLPPSLSSPLPLDIVTALPTDPNITRKILNQSISPDGTQIVYIEGIYAKSSSEKPWYDLYQSTGVYMADANGKNPKLIGKIEPQSYISGDTTYSKTIQEISAESKISWSPDGKQILFNNFQISSLDSKDSTKYNFFDVDRTLLKKININDVAVRGYDIRFSQNSKNIIYLKSVGKNPYGINSGFSIVYGGADIYSLDLASNTSRKILDASIIKSAFQQDERVIGVSAFSLSPDGKKFIVSVHYYEPNLLDQLNDARANNKPIPIIVSTKGEHALYTINVDGTNKKEIIVTFAPTTYFWSPDSSKIAFLSPDKNTYAPRISVINADGTDRKEISRTDIEKLIGWSPDGSKIAFMTKMLDTSAVPYAFNIINANGAGEKIVASNVYELLSWTQDGSTLVFSKPISVGSGWSPLESEIVTHKITP